MGFLYDWCEERFEIQSIADDILAKFVPAHVNIFYCLGGIMLTSLIFQGGSGFALTISYQPTVVEAFPSVQFILYHVNLGWFIQSIHRWSSGVMVLILILHIARVYLTSLNLHDIRLIELMQKLLQLFVDNKLSKQNLIHLEI